MKILNFMQYSGLNVFSLREYRYFWIAAATSNIGYWSLTYGRMWLMHDLTDSPVWVGAVATVAQAPVFLFSVWGGVFADRVNRLKVVRITRTLFGVLALIMVALIYFNLIQPWHILAISLGTGLLFSVDLPSRIAMMPSIVNKKQLPSAIALYSVVFGGSQIIGPSILSATVQNIGMDGFFLMIAISYFATTVVLLKMDPKLHEPSGKRLNPFNELLAGFRYFKGEKTLYGIILIGIFGGIVGSSYETLLPKFTGIIFSGNVTDYSKLLVYSGIGGLLGTLIILLLGKRGFTVQLVFIGGLISGLSILLIGSSVLIWLIFLGCVILGASRTISSSMLQTLYQTLAKDEYRGRAMSIYQLTWSVSALGGILMGYIGKTYGIIETLNLSGLIVIGVYIIGAVFFFKILLLGYQKIMK